MVNRVVSTKLTEEEHKKILEFCNDAGITVSTLVKQSIMDKVKKVKGHDDWKNSELDSQTVPKRRSTSIRATTGDHVQESKTEVERENVRALLKIIADIQKMMN